MRVFTLKLQHTCRDLTRAYLLNYGVMYLHTLLELPNQTKPYVRTYVDVSQRA
jgi:hypothetical protein